MYSQISPQTWNAVSPSEPGCLPDPSTWMYCIKHSQKSEASRQVRLLEACKAHGVIVENIGLLLEVGRHWHG